MNVGHRVSSSTRPGRGTRSRAPMRELDAWSGSPTGAAITQRASPPTVEDTHRGSALGAEESQRRIQIGFTGRYHDDETGLVYFRARQYSPTLGRFIGRDRKEYINGMSLYESYMVPNQVDPSGSSTSFGGIHVGATRFLQNGEAGGLTTHKLEISTWCNKCLNGSSSTADSKCPTKGKWKMSGTIDFSIDVTIATHSYDDLENHTGDFQRSSANTDMSYEHEMMHAHDWEDWFFQNADEMDHDFNTDCKFDSKSDCEEEAAKQKDKWDRRETLKGLSENLHLPHSRWDPVNPAGYIEGYQEHSNGYVPPPLPPIDFQIPPE